MMLTQIARRARICLRPLAADAASSTKHDRPDDGFTLLEVVVAFTLLVIVAAAVVAALVNGARATSISQQRAAAANIARQYIESARTQDVYVTPTATPIAVPGTNYTVCRSVSPVGGAIGTLTGNGCTSTATTGCTSKTAGQLYYVTVVVTWPSTSSGSSTTRSLRSDTEMAC